MPDPTYIAGTVKLGITPANGRVVIAMTHDPDPEENLRQVLATTTTDLGGNYQLVLSDGPTEPMIVVAFDDPGIAWTPSTTLAPGDRIGAAPFAGPLFEVTIGGASGASEPDWEALAVSGGSVGNAYVAPVTYQAPQASGPIHPSATGV